MIGVDGRACANPAPAAALSKRQPAQAAGQGWAPAWQSARRILCVRLDNLGDVLMTTPALHALKQAVPGRHLSLLASGGGAAISPWLDDVDDTIAWEAPWMKGRMTGVGSTGSGSPDIHSQGQGCADLRLCERLRAGNYDAAVIFTVYSQSPLPAALLCHLAGIPLRLAHCRENPYGLLSHWIPETEPHGQVRHEARRQLDLVASTGAVSPDARMRLHVPDEARRKVDVLLHELGLRQGQPVVVMHPGATAASRRYPPSGFAQAAAELACTHDGLVLVTGGSGEADLTAEVCALADVPSRRSSSGQSLRLGQVRDLAGRLALPVFAALIERCDVLVSNNSGPVHIAAAVGTPVVDLYALTNPQHTPWQVPHRLLYHDVPCRYCYRSVCPQGHHDCLRKVAPESIVTAAHELLLQRHTRHAAERVQAGFHRHGDPHPVQLPMPAPTTA